MRSHPTLPQALLGGFAGTLAMTATHLIYGSLLGAIAGTGRSARLAQA
jgi:hypothetical protein